MEMQDLRLLLVEPSLVQQRIIRGQLESLGVHRLTSAESSGEALSAIRAKKPDVVLSAMHLADMTGADMLLSLRGHKMTKDLPFILISSERSDQYLEPIKQSGVTAIIKKPCKESDLCQALLRTVELIDPHPIEVSAQVLNNLRVLVVDDSRTARSFVIRVLTNLGLQHFTQAEDGQDAVEIFQRSTFDLVVTDYNMPRLDGQGLLRFIRNESVRPNTPVLMVTTESNEARLSAVSQLGVSAMCDKPFEPHVVRRLIAGIIDVEAS